MVWMKFPGINCQSKSSNQSSPVHQKAGNESTSDGEEGRGAWNRFKSHSLPPPPVLHCLERIEFIAQEHRERENKKAFTFPIQRQSLHTDGLPPVESRAGGRCILQKKNLPTRPFLLSPLTPGNKTCKVEHAKHRIYRASPHLTRQMCGNNEVDKTSTSTACGGRGDFEKDVRMH